MSTVRAVASIFGKTGSARSAGSSEGSGRSGANTPPSGDAARGLVFPPLNIAQTGIDIDMDNLFRRCSLHMTVQTCHVATMPLAVTLPG